MTQSWAEDVVARIAGEVRRLRGKEHSALSAAKLADRTHDIGYGISRSVVADLENGRKKSLDISELLVLAAALGVSPAQLVYPDLPKGNVEVLPGLDQESHDALRWFSGEAGLMKPTDDWIDGQNGEPIEVWVREQFDPKNDRIAIVRDWLQALQAMRKARVQLRNGLSKKESAEHIEAMQFMYEEARKRSEELFRQMTELNMDIGDDGTNG
ncbi:helix-turn-helix domain-containing protein [Rhodococcus sp. BP-252]|uniref:helix-turn-helix domain-containing protein n=1 Tax=unclassified Rhodococcus (in: high G+C Gram-positive bacteria) TaxID=192944 RepID=UPI001C9B1DEE|nr:MULTISPECIES: helix-turn-helix transcriptional regulator [unclassified Rhodococcus (in: high G+C Gram-positive bacteria)]MBY6412893.1 helix-turn-helix domain-containing protein [Rhodococcus sp. BP-320]MBY6417570.1 helix-turn-helix domain-containing protein [Rhodococcus sp. BP-321]MBY6423058.1 helix-turn-helix domain-containing protein [Rhodococcus sp. BP-324]MBY6427594.1 helix-turn-helix domain-containing protein [Rhodococcus sp. BP-323]MBY6432758.1 helix-turn-helix domain-containing protei